MVMIGLMILKKQYGAYTRVATPNTDAWVAPQVFQGTNTEVTVAESYKVRERFSGFSPLFLYTSANILPGTKIAKY